MSALPLSAGAAPTLSGTFTGIATGTTTMAQSGHPGTVDGSVATGSFIIGAASCAYGDPTQGMCFEAPSEVTLTLSIGGQTLPFQDPGSDLMLEQAADGQRLIANAGIEYPYYNASITLDGGPDAFATGLDLTTLHPGPVTAGLVRFLDGRDFFGAVTVSSITVDGATYDLAVPEPAGSAVLGAGLIGLWSIRRRGTRARTRAID